MKRAILFIIAIFFLINLNAQSSISDKEIENITIFTKVWGFLKYYHPKVAKGKFDWDMEFILKIDEATKLKTKDEINTFYLNWLNGLGKVRECKKCSDDLSELHTKNLDLDFLYDSISFNNELINKLDYIRKNRNQGKNYYASHWLFRKALSFSREKTYKDSVFPTEQFRLYALARTWNMINYFFPYKYLTDKAWDDVLTEFIPEFKFSPDTVSYNMSALKLIANLNDSHANTFYSSYMNKHKNFGRYYVPFGGEIINDKAVVTYLKNNTLAEKDDIQVGDVILKVDGVEIEEIIKTKSKYLPTSNKSTLLRDIYDILFYGHTESIKITYERNNVISSKIINRYYNAYVKGLFKYYKEESQETYKVLDDNVGYINAGTLKKKQVKTVLEELNNTKSLIIDIRNYPSGIMYELAKYLNDAEKEFAVLIRPNINYPGTYVYKDPYTCGEQNENFYKGKVILLVNENTQSHAETTAMALQTLPNVITLGSQTAGANGDIVSYQFPGIKNYPSYTGIGIYYPDGREIQRVGVKIDIKFYPTIEGIRQGRDELLEKAIEIATKN